MLLVLLPNQLIQTNIIDDIVNKYTLNKIVLYEHNKFFTKFKYHKSKLIFHRASMKAYYDLLIKTYPKIQVEYVEYTKEFRDLAIKTDIVIFDPVDFEISKEFKKYTNETQQKLTVIDSPLFILTVNNIDDYVNDYVKEAKHTYHNATFYKYMRRTKNILMDGDKPINNTWSFDKENRHRFIDNYKEDKLQYVNNKYIVEATEYINKNFNNNIGSGYVIVPITHADAIKHYHKFLKHKLKLFGPYQDAIKDDINIGYHSCISALLNTGLLDVRYVINAALKYKDVVPIESLEAFIRQILSWREYVRMLYIKEYKALTTMNFLNHKNKLPKTWYTATTGILPIDTTIKKAIATAYLHHIERLMIIGNFMLISYIRPKDVYKWFIEVVSIDAYEWVMVPNIYGMSQHSVGTLMMNRPYVSSSNYIYKMSNYKRNNKTNWAIIWDELYHKFLEKHKTYLSKNYIMANIVKKSK